jgi:hypothetical protein
MQNEHVHKNTRFNSEKKKEVEGKRCVCVCVNFLEIIIF